MFSWFRAPESNPSSSNPATLGTPPTSHAVPPVLDPAPVSLTTPNPVTRDPATEDLSAPPAPARVADDAPDTVGTVADDLVSLGRVFPQAGGPATSIHPSSNRSSSLIPLARLLGLGSDGAPEEGTDATTATGAEEDADARSLTSMLGPQRPLHPDHAAHVAAQYIQAACSAAGPTVVAGLAARIFEESQSAPEAQVPPLSPSARPQRVVQTEALAEPPQSARPAPTDAVQEDNGSSVISDDWVIVEDHPRTPPRTTAPPLTRPLVTPATPTMPIAQQHIDTPPRAAAAVTSGAPSHRIDEALDAVQTVAPSAPTSPTRPSTRAVARAIMSPPMSPVVAQAEITWLRSQLAARSDDYRRALEHSATVEHRALEVLQDIEQVARSVIKQEEADAVQAIATQQQALAVLQAAQSAKALQEEERFARNEVERETTEAFQASVATLQQDLQQEEERFARSEVERETTEAFQASVATLQQDLQQEEERFARSEVEREATEAFQASMTTFQHGSLQLTEQTTRVETMHAEQAVRATLTAQQATKQLAVAERLRQQQEALENLTTQAAAKPTSPALPTAETMLAQFGLVGAGTAIATALKHCPQLVTHQHVVVWATSLGL